MNIQYYKQPTEKDLNKAEYIGVEFREGTKAVVGKIMNYKSDAEYTLLPAKLEVNGLRHPTSISDKTVSDLLKRCEGIQVVMIFINQKDCEEWATNVVVGRV